MNKAHAAPPNQIGLAPLFRLVRIEFAKVCGCNGPDNSTHLREPSLHQRISVVGSFPRSLRTQNLKTDGVTIHVRAGGRGPAVVMLHGFGDTGDMWAPVATILAKDHVVVVPDLRGMGLSSHPKSGYEKKTQARDIAAVLDRLKTPCKGDGSDPAELKVRIAHRRTRAMQSGGEASVRGSVPCDARNGFQSGCRAARSSRLSLRSRQKRTFEGSLRGRERAHNLGELDDAAKHRSGNFSRMSTLPIRLLSFTRSAGRPAGVGREAKANFEQFISCRWGKPGKAQNPAHRAPSRAERSAVTSSGSGEPLVLVHIDQQLRYPHDQTIKTNSPPISAQHRHPCCGVGTIPCGRCPDARACGHAFLS